MGEAMMFGAAVFAGWVILDVTKARDWRNMNLLESLIAGFFGAVGWYMIDLFL
ncbi:hypothetical protein SAMN05192534_108102 [Alteribacillus persepolensis]|uniref:Zinc transporter, ZIP family n=1 Tax=Alteribacillus persepolensis TaxID=568899 RepID=A0A1G8E1E7_9BACI|nr:hypothetical protein [Alteribacillus persepolensis]SDH63695.1 hypothetical protein SAMN05192534_108102 [Alteribacillus persepolensis]